MIIGGADADHYLFLFQFIYIYVFIYIYKRVTLQQTLIYKGPSAKIKLTIEMKDKI